MPSPAIDEGVAPVMILPLNSISPAVGLVDAGQHVHHGALARTVGPDQAVHGALGDLQIDFVQRLQSAELHHEVVRFQQIAVGRDRMIRHRPDMLLVAVLQYRHMAVYPLRPESSR